MVAFTKPSDQLKLISAGACRGTEYLFENVNDEQSKLWCNVVTHQMSVRAIAYFLIGHVEHHVGVVRQRYLEIAD